MDHFTKISLSILGGVIGGFASSFFKNGKLEVIDIIAVAVCSLIIFGIVRKERKKR